MSKQIVQLSSNLSNLERRDLARLELAQYENIGKFRYITRSPHVRHIILSNGNSGHSTVDVMNIVYEAKHDDAATDFEPRIAWRNYKNRLKKSDVQLCQKLAQLKIPSWEDGKKYPTDIVDTGWLFFLLVGMHTPITNEIRAAFADELNKYDREHHAAIISELDRETGWAGTAIHLQLQGSYDEDDLNSPDVPAGSYYGR